MVSIDQRSEKSIHSDAIPKEAPEVYVEEARSQTLLTLDTGIIPANLPEAPASGPFHVYIQNPSDGELSENSWKPS